MKSDCGFLPERSTMSHVGRLPPDEVRGLAWRTLIEAAGVTAYLENGSAPAHQVVGGPAPPGDPAAAGSVGVVVGGVPEGEDAGDGDVVR